MRARLRRAAGALAVVALSGLAAAQSPNAGTQFGFEIRFVIVLVINLLLGGALVGFGPNYARDTVTELREDPGAAFLWGLIFGIGVPIVLVILAVTIIGLVVAIPGLIILMVVGLVGNAVTIVWLGSLLNGGSIGGKSAVLGAVALAVPAAIPVLGNLVTTLVGFFGLGVVGRRLYKSYRN